MPRRLFSALGGCCLASAFALAQTPGYELIKINSDPAKGFQWPYYLTLPSSAREPAVLLVVPNNSGTTSDDQTFHDAQARSTAQTWATQSELGNLRCPVLVPTFPRPQSDYEVYTQALDRATLVTRLPGLERIDRQLVAMISDARSRLAARGVAIDEKVWLWGFSATGSFVSRFLILHPEIVKAAFFGAGGFGPPVPLAEHKGRRLEYPWGVADLELLTGGITARAEVRIFGEGFSTPLATVPVTLSRGGRREIDICRDSQGNAEAGWVKIGADSGYLAGRARFSSPAREQGSLVANAGLTGGVLAGLRDAATSRINLANPGDTPVVVRLFAHDAAGNELAQTIFEVGANAKVAGTVGAIFGKAAPGVSHVRFEARGRTAAALVNVAADGTLLEVLPSFRHYAR
jgi:dienelactone hydrolase